MRPARITILSSGPLCRNPRAHKEAATLAQAGYAVTVATVARHTRFEAYDAAILQNARFRKIVVDRCSHKLSNRAFSFAERALAFALRRTGIAHPAQLGPYHALRRLVLRSDWDLLIAHTELPLCIAAELLSTNRPVAADIEDWHSRDLLPSSRAHRPLSLLARAETRVLRLARHTTTTSHALATALATACKTPAPQVIQNVFPLSPAPDPNARPARPSLVWFSQTIGPGRGLEAFLKAWMLTQTSSDLNLIGDISEPYRRLLLDAIPESHRQRIHIHHLVAPDQLPALLSRQHLGLALEPFEPDNKNLTISNKIFQYLDAGLAVLATPTLGQREVFTNRQEIGLLDDLTEPDSLARRLDALLDDPERLTSLGQNARTAAEQEFCWEKTAPRLLATVSRSLRQLS